MKIDDIPGLPKGISSENMETGNESEVSDDTDFELDESDIQQLNKETRTSGPETKSIKDELRLKIQNSRLLKGQDELEVSFEPPKEYELTEEEKRKIELRKYRNRRSANKSRIMRKQQLENLLADEKKFTAANQKLKSEVEALRNIKLKFETILSKHESSQTCHLQKPNAVASQVDGGSQETLLPLFGKGTVSSGSVVSRGTVNTFTPSACSSYGSVGENQARLRNLSKDQKIALLKAYLKDNQAKPEVQQLICKITEMTKSNNGDEVQSFQ